jgi:ATP adenylyltransferase
MAWIGAGAAPAGCIFCEAWSASDDRPRYVLTRGQHAFALLNAYPYAPGHLMIAPRRHVSAVTEAGLDEMTDAMAVLQRSITALGEEYRPHGYNVGINQGAAAGAGIVDHLHIHVVPRWSGDSNFMGVVGETRVLPETLDRTWERLRSRLSD